MKLLLALSLISGLAVGSIYKFKVPALDGGIINFANYKGKKILIVNTASECGLTPQYEGLEELYKTYKSKLVIIGFPANNFGGQEPGSSKEIAKKKKKNYGVTFPMAEKVSVKGKDQAAIYKYLAAEASKKGFINPVTWNFGKYLLDEKGKLVAVFEPKTTPMSPQITNWLK